MASGILGQAAPSASTDTSVYTVPASTLSVVNINVLNRSGANPVDVRIALAAAGTPTSSEYIEYDVTVPAKGVVERTGIALQAGKIVVVQCSTGDTTVNVYGLEQSV